MGNYLTTKADLSRAATVGQTLNNPAQPSLVIEPMVVYFPLAPQEQGASMASIQVSNLSAEPVTLSGIELQGAGADDYTIQHDGCSGLLVKGTGCDIWVSFKPSGQGASNAQLVIDSNLASVRNQMVLLTNTESAHNEQLRRQPPILKTLQVVEDSNHQVLDLTQSALLTKGQAYRFQWTLSGYAPSYQSRVAFFRCPAADNSCAQTLETAQKLALSPLLSAKTVQQEGSAPPLQHSQYQYTFTPEQSFFETGDRLVMRFYHKSIDDTAANQPSASLLLPGSLLPVTIHYGKDGRRLVFGLQ